MRLHRQHFLVAACGFFSFVPAGTTTVRANGEAGQSTIRTVSVSTPAPMGAPATGRSQALPAINLPQTDRPAVNAAATSSIVIVKSSERQWTPSVRQPAPEKNQIRQVQFVSAEPVTTSPADERSSITFEPIASAPNEPAAVATMDKMSSAVPAQPTHTSAAAAPPAPAIAERQPQPRPAAVSPTGEALARINPQLANQMRQALETPGAYTMRATLSQIPRRTSAARPAASAASRTAPKPFEGIQSAPSVSPYLNLYRNEDDDQVASNYFAFVRPQTEQFEANRAQQLEMQRLQRQVQGGSAAAAGPQRSATAMPQTGSSTRFMDTAQYYGAWQR